MAVDFTEQVLGTMQRRLSRRGFLATCGKVSLAVGAAAAGVHLAARRTYAQFAMVTDRPDVLEVDDHGRLHSMTGPAIRWRDGYAMWYWHGTHVPQRLIERLAAAAPCDEAGLATVEGLRRWRVAAFGSEILAALEGR